MSIQKVRFFVTVAVFRTLKETLFQDSEKGSPVKTVLGSLTQAQPVQTKVVVPSRKGCRIGPTKVLRPHFFLLFITRQASYYVFVQARDYERSKEQTKERGPKGASIFPQNPTRIEDVPFR